MATSNKRSKKLVLQILGITAFLAIALFMYIKHKYHKPHFTLYKIFGIHIPDGYTIHGIDVSHHEGLINWDMVKNMRTNGVGIDFVFAKATEGLTIIDEQYATNMQELTKRSIIKGAYHYLKPSLDGKAQAAFFIQHANLKKGDLRPVLDIEEVNNVSYEQIKTCVISWLNEVEKYYGIKPIIYSNAAFYNQFVQDYTTDYPLWVAHYTITNNPAVSHKWVIWQHTEDATVSGINDKVDFNCYKGNKFTFNELLIP
jgi:lysozyme